MPGSTAKATKTAVVAGLRTHFETLPDFNATAAENQLNVQYAYEFGSTAAQRIYTGRTRAETPPAALRSGRNHRQETGRFDLTILVTLPGSDTEAAEDRVDAIGTQVEEWIADRKQGDGLGVTGLYELLVEGYESDYRGGDRSRTVIRTYIVLWRSRLT